jgi:electron-transferring-flavoprotein dehydrogenase
MEPQREQIEFDALIVGGGPAGLAAAIRLMQMAKERSRPIEVALIDKGAEIGAHALSGAVVDPKAFQELLPDYKERGFPIETTVRGDLFGFMTQNRFIRMPMVPRHMHNTGRPIVSLSKVTRWMAEIAEQMEVNIFPGFAGKEVLFSEDGKRIIGVRTGDKGIDPDGKPKANFEPGIDLMAKVVILAEGARGSLLKEIDARLGLSAGKMPQVYETGIKEVIQLPEDHFFTRSAANDIHTLGYPLDLHTPGGGFIYEMGKNRVSIGFLVGLCYENPLLDPYDVFVRFKRHPFVADLIKDGKVLEQGARTVSTGGYYTMPRLFSDGALFAGAAAGFHNSPALKGVHAAVKSGMLAAETAFDALEKEDASAAVLSGYADRFEKSWLKKELYEGRNFAQALAKKAPLKFIHLGVQYVTGGKGIVDPMHTVEDAQTFAPAGFGGTALTAPIDPSIYDGKLYVDKLTGVYLSRTIHREDQPPHLIVHDRDLCVRSCWPRYRSPCTRFCPGKVYEMEEDGAGGRKLKVNFSNCLHCKTCDVKDPFGNITWTCPEGGEGPGYTLL